MTEDYKQEKSGLTQRAALIMAANVIALAIMFILPMVLVRTFSQTEFGLYKQAFQIQLTALGLLNLQVAVSVFYFMARAPEKKLQVVLNVIIFYGLVGALVFLTFLVWPNWVSLVFKSSDLVPYVPLLGLVIMVNLVSTNLESVPVAAGDTRIASMLIVIAQLTKAIVMVMAAIIFGTITAILIAALIHGILQTIYMLVYINRRFGRFWAPIDWALFRAQVGNALPFGVGGIAASVRVDMHNFFVSHYFDAAAFAVYSVGCFQLPLLGMLAISFATALNPVLAEHKESGDYRAIIVVWMDVIRKLSFFLFPAYMVMLIFRDEIITGLFTQAYASSVPIFAINLANVLLAVMVQLHVLRLFDQLKYFRLQLCMVLIPVNFAALYLGLKVGGLVGVVVAVLLVQTLDVGITVLKICLELKFKRTDLSFVKPVLRIGIAAAIAGASTYLVRLSIENLPPIPRVVIGTAFFGAVYLIAVVLVGAVSREEKASIREMIVKYTSRGVARIKLPSTAD